MKPRRLFPVFADFLPHFQGGFSNTARAVFYRFFYEVHFCGKMRGVCRIIKCGKKPLRFFFGGKQINRPNVTQISHLDGV